EELAGEPIGRLFDRVKVDGIVRADILTTLVDEPLDLATDRKLVRVPIEELQTLLNGTFHQQIIGIEKSDEVPLRGPQAGVSCRGRTKTSRKSDQPRVETGE